MQSLIGFAVRLMEGLFVVGLAGTSLVLVKVFIEDVEVLIDRSPDTEH